MSVEHDINLIERNRFATSFTHLDAAGNPVDLTGYTAYAQVRDKPDDVSPRLTLDTVVDGPAGQVTVSYDDPQYDDWLNSNWGLLLVHATKPPIVLAYGKVEFTRIVVKVPA